jgi:hypothetical protein
MRCSHKCRVKNNADISGFTKGGYRWQLKGTRTRLGTRHAMLSSLMHSSQETSDDYRERAGMVCRVEVLARGQSRGCAASGKNNPKIGLYPKAETRDLREAVA